MKAEQLKICLDPGHGMGNSSPRAYDPGAVAAGVAEADIALEWALTIKWVGLHYFGIKSHQIILTRTTADSYAPVVKRDDLARAAGCTHFLSVHANASVNPLVSGTETFYSEDKGREQSYAFAGLVQAAALGAMKSKNRKVKPESQSQHRGLAVFESADKMKAALLETGFITNRGDRERMQNREARLWFAVKFWRDVLGVQAVAGPWQ